ncbi:hypothetical protein C4D60_Mb05t27230 [Musa balbisiana]|uniref:Uncharacterized protein n=1 Tax=Musa balbisiana TaxID=52838 RepID=A0A4S8JZ95_MUSBA|nr:hypothetical protein C4D60_Mb05t27230 [Musa balbisiana]
MAEAVEEEKGSARRQRNREEPWRLKGGGGGGVTLEGYVPRPGWFARTRSLTDEDLEELKGCLDLGFGFSYEEIPGLCNTLPALELCYSLCQSVRLNDHPDRYPSPSSSPAANWRFSSPGREEEGDPMAEAVEEEKGSARRQRNREEPWRLKGGGGGGVTLEGYVPRPGWFARTRSLTDEDLEELKGCLDLGFGFSYEEIPGLCNTLPALELCYSLCQSVRLNDHPDRYPSPSSSPAANWRFSSPGDDPDEVKARLKYWAQAVACTVRLCSLRRGLNSTSCCTHRAANAASCGNKSSLGLVIPQTSYGHEISSLKIEGQN